MRTLNIRMYQGWIQGGHKSLETTPQPYQEVRKTDVFV